MENAASLWRTRTLARGGRGGTIDMYAYHLRPVGDTRMNAPETLSRWATPGSSRVPFWAYTDAQLYRQELDKLFYGPHWSYVGLEVEVPNVGDYKLTSIGERQVILVRDRVA